MGESLGKKIKELRTGMKLTLREAARQLDISPPHMSDIEYGRRNPSPELMQKLAALFGVPLDELEAVDSRLAPELKEWIDENPAVGQLLRTIRESGKDPEQLRKELQRVHKKREK